MVCRSVFELDGCNVDYSLPRSVGDDVHEAQEVLTGVPEAHAASDSAFIVGGRAREIECDHALVLVPYVDHPVEFLDSRIYMEG